LLDVV
jgi:hypothetical protein